QSTVDPAVQGRVFTVLGSLLALSSPVGLAFAGPTGDLVGVRFWFILASSLCVITGAGMFFLPAMVQIEDQRRRQIEDEGQTTASSPDSIQVSSSE
ncbi:MAG: hypothetical protein R3300_19785, partial [Candidatus Promineifilaceae bacterium]|nr:hypothetical protein [Candidatus Promineifilaceae bacterium]